MSDNPEPEVDERLTMEPEQMAQLFINRIGGQRATRMVCWISEKDHRERYMIIFENNAGILFAPAPNGVNLIATIILEVECRGEGAA